MACPRRGEVGAGIRVALATGGQQVLFDHLGMFIGRRQDIVDAMTVIADRLVGLLVGRLLLKECDRGAVKISDIGVKDIGRDVVFPH